jgi:Spy/CpxP family protein refolding chaperone
MTMQSRSFRTLAAVALALTAAISTAALAQPPAGRGRGFAGGGFGPGGPIPIPILPLLNLSEDQKQQIQAVTDEQRDQGAQQSMKTMMDLQRSLQAAIYADNPDPGRIDQIRSSIAEAEAAALSARVELEVKIAQILTPEQRKTTRDLIAQGPPAARGGGAGHSRQP